MKSVWLFLLLGRCSSFLFDSQGTDKCIAPPPCICSPSVITCEGTGLSAIPSFKEAEVPFQRLTLKLNNNNIQGVDNDSFVNIETTNATDVVIDLSDNQISFISDSAFSAISGLVSMLKLRNNNLTTIPSELGALSNLKSLDIRGNQLHSLSNPVTYVLGRSLTSLSISLNLFSKWPSELRYFRLLSKLTIDGYQLQRFPLDALKGVEGTLTSLDISNSRLDRIPSVVCHLYNLRRLTYSSNPETKTPIFEPCSRNITSVHFLGLKDNNLTSFPNVFKTFVSLDYLDISANKIKTIPTDKIPENNVLTHLNISQNLLNRVPNAVNRFDVLKALYIAGNQITSLEGYDLVNTSHLSVLYLQNNPIEYISSDAFNNINALEVLSLADTKVTSIPRAITSLSRINRVDVEGAPIQCTCQMDFLKTWAKNSSRISGTCEGTRESISNFIMNFLPLCP